MKLEDFMLMFPDEQLRVAMAGSKEEKIRERNFPDKLLALPSADKEIYLPLFLKCLEAQRETKYAKDAARFFYKFNDTVKEKQAVLPEAAKILSEVVSQVYAKELKKLQEKYESNDATTTVAPAHGSSQQVAFGRVPEADILLSKFHEVAVNEALVVKIREVVDEHCSQNPVMRDIRNRHKELEAEREKTGKFVEHGIEFVTKMPDSQHMILMPQPTPREFDAFCDMLVARKVALVITLCSPYEGPDIIPYYNPALMNPQDLSTKGRKIECIRQSVLYEGEEAAPVPEVKKLLESAPGAINTKHESLKQWRPQIVLYELLASNPTGGHPLNLLHYKNWPDRQFAPDLKALHFMFQVRDKLLPSLEHPMVVHCRAGIGRTANIALIDWARVRIKKMLGEGKKLHEISLNIPEMLYALRTCRPKMGSNYKKMGKIYQVLGQHFDELKKTHQ